MTAAPARSSWSLAILIAALAMIGPFSIDAYLPAFHDIARDFDVSSIAVQQTLSSYLVAYAFMMLWHGALSDALGRRPIILIGLGIYAIATLGCAIAGNIETLWLFRAVQGMTGGIGIVIGRAIIRDRYHGADAQRLMAQITLVFSIAPALAPVLGGILLNALGWRSIFWVLLVLVVALLAWSIRKLPETLPISARQSLRPRLVLPNYAIALRHPDFLLLSAIPALNFAGFFLYVASAPAFLIDLLGISSYGFAWLFGPLIAGVMLGAYTSGRLAGRMSQQSTVRLGYAVMLCGVVANLLVCWFIAPGMPWNVLPLMIFTVGSSIVMPSVTLLLLDLFPTMRGLVSSLQGFVQFGLAAFNAGTISPILAHSLRALALGMAVFTLLSLAMWLVYLRREARHAKR